MLVTQTATDADEGKRLARSFSQHRHERGLVGRFADGRNARSADAIGVNAMSKPYHVLAVSSRIVAVLIAGAALAHAQSSPVVFQGLPHTAVGHATLQLDPVRGALDVIGLGPTGADGVAVRRNGATSWTARVEVPTTGIPLDLLWSALADGRAIGSGRLRQDGDNFEMSGIFTGATTAPTFSAQVYNNGRLVGAVGGQPPDGRIFVPVSICTWVPEQCQIAIEFQTLDDGACMVKIVGSRAVPIRLPNGTIVTGNELRLVEEVRPAGHYPYLGFDTMTMRSDAPSFAILSESMR